jgi:hypothetical protein
MMNAHGLMMALAGYPGFLEVRDDSGVPRVYHGVDRRVGEDGQEYLVLLSTPRSKPEKAPEPESNTTPAKLRPGLREAK